MTKDEYKLGQNRQNYKNQMGTPGGGPGPGMGGSGERANNFAGTWGKLLMYCKKYWSVMAAALICAAIGTVLTLVGPDKISEMTDQITEGIMLGINLNVIAKIGMTLIMIYAISYILSLLQGIVMATVTQKISKNLRTDIASKINRLPISYYNRTTTGDVLSRVTNDVDTIGTSINQSIGTLVSSVALLAGCLIMMLKTNVIMTITAVVASLLGFGIMMFIMGKSQKYFTRQQQHLGEINGHIEEIYAGHTVVKAYNGEAKAKETFNKLNKDLKESGLKAQSLSGLMMPIMSFIGNLGYVAVCVVGAVLTMNGNITFGVIVAFMMYVRYFTQPLSQIAQSVQSLQSAAAASERVFEFLLEAEMEDESKKVKKIAIVGPTGAGKTTMVNLLMRFHEIQNGEIKIDGIPISQMTREEVHAQFCMVLQDTWLFEGTVRENLVYITKDVADEQVTRACKAVGLHRFIRTLPQGYDTVLNDQVNLSMGQKQQLTIARAMIANRPMLILDEATSSVDTRTELQIQKATDALMKGRTSFIIAHRLSTIKNANLILVMKDGDIIESGSHNELLNLNGFYAELYNSQFEQAS